MTSCSRRCNIGTSSSPTSGRQRRRRREVSAPNPVACHGSEPRAQPSPGTGGALGGGGGGAANGGEGGGSASVAHGGGPRVALLSRALMESPSHAAGAVAGARPRPHAPGPSSFVDEHRDKPDPERDNLSVATGCPNERCRAGVGADNGTQGPAPLPSAPSSWDSSPEAPQRAKSSESARRSPAPRSAEAAARNERGGGLLTTSLSSSAPFAERPNCGVHWDIALCRHP